MLSIVLVAAYHIYASPEHDISALSHVADGIALVRLPAQAINQHLDSLSRQALNSSRLVWTGVADRLRRLV